MDQKTSDLIAALYDAAADRELWPGFLKLLAQSFSASLTQYVAADSRMTVVDTMAYGADRQALEAYASYNTNGLNH